jgi:DNA-binding FadR family transcriptional regulator
MKSRIVLSWENPAMQRHRPKSLAAEVVTTLAGQIREGRYPAQSRLPTEAALMQEFAVSRTVVREAISRLQASGFVETRHGVGTFVIGIGESPFRVGREDLKTLKDVVHLLELRMSVEVEAASLAALRRSPANLRRMTAALRDFRKAVVSGADAVDADFRFHAEIARATQNDYFIHLMNTLGSTAIPRSRLRSQSAESDVSDYLERVDAEHRRIFEAIAQGHAEAAAAAMRQHLGRSLERRREAADVLRVAGSAR